MASSKRQIYSVRRTPTVKTSAGEVDPNLADYLRRLQEQADLEAKSQYYTSSTTKTRPETGFGASKHAPTGLWEGGWLSAEERKRIAEEDRRLALAQRAASEEKERALARALSGKSSTVSYDWYYNDYNTPDYYDDVYEYYDDEDDYEY